ncbi:asparagine synthase B [Flavobacteriaceae bacterium 14752]|uniref:asparagine synthase B n=1 Tax=Mesohalobacter salilacus TaxID=2491711 RepID=UPI000F6394D4|nr:asparagine synthase B [Flavobacteriaceae bacterium 14752]
MCGIVCAFDFKSKAEQLRPRVLEMSKKLRHRGPDWSGIFANDKAILAHERLAIVDPTSGKQPIFSVDKNLVLAANGEIYNHKKLHNEVNDYNFTTQSDCEVILALYQKHGHTFLNKLNGIFGFALYDCDNDNYLIARDHMGIIPLYVGWDENGGLYVASELKALEGICQKIEVFPPGHYMTKGSEGFQQWYKPTWRNFDDVKNNKTSIGKIREALDAAVHRQLMSDVPYGVLLSGGLDSSVTSALAKKYAEKRIEEHDKTGAWWPKLHSFATGLEGSPDLKAAKLVAEHLDTVHHEVIFTIQEGLDAIKDVIYHLETYDVTTVRASTPMFLMARAIKAMGIKMVLSGEGSDELFGGYLYFHKAPNAKAFHEETVRKLDKLYLYDCLRANKSLAAWGIEGRVPFLDKEFIDVAMSINPEDKMIKDGRIEKWVLRKAFEDLLPQEVAWRQKEQFSDGVGYSWIDTLKEKVNQEVSDEQLKNAHFKFPYQPPKSKEEFYYRSIFAEHFPSQTAAKTVPSVPSVACSSEVALEWDASFKNMNDPSGRAVSNVHTESYDKN